MFPARLRLLTAAAVIGLAASGLAACSGSGGSLRDSFDTRLRRR